LEEGNFIGWERLVPFRILGDWSRQSVCPFGNVHEGIQKAVWLGYIPLLVRRVRVRRFFLLHRVSPSVFRIPGLGSRGGSYGNQPSFLLVSDGRRN